MRFFNTAGPVRREGALLHPGLIALDQEGTPRIADPMYAEVLQTERV